MKNMWATRDQNALLSLVLTCNAGIGTLSGAFPTLVGRLSQSIKDSFKGKAHMCTTLIRASICQSGWLIEGPVCFH